MVVVLGTCVSVVLKQVALYLKHWGRVERSCPGGRQRPREVVDGRRGKEEEESELPSPRQKAHMNTAEASSVKWEREREMQNTAETIRVAN